MATSNVICAIVSSDC